MNITKKEFNEFFKTISVKLDVEFRVRLTPSEFLNSIREDKENFCFLLIALCENFKKNDVEFRVKFRASEFFRSFSDKDGFCPPLMALCENFKRKYEFEFIDPKGGVANEVIEKLTGIPKEKIIYIKENYKELFNKYKIPVYQGGK